MLKKKSNMLCHKFQNETALRLRAAGSVPFFRVLQHMKGLEEEKVFLQRHLCWVIHWAVTLRASPLQPCRAAPSTFRLQQMFQSLSASAGSNQLTSEFSLCDLLNLISPSGSSFTPRRRSCIIYHKDKRPDLFQGGGEAVCVPSDE